MNRVDFPSIVSVANPAPSALLFLGRGIGISAACGPVLLGIIGPGRPSRKGTSFSRDEWPALHVRQVNRGSASARGLVTVKGADVRLLPADSCT